MNTENVANVGGAVAEQKSWGDVAMGVVNYGAGVLREAAARQQRRQDVLTLQHVWMYDEEEASRKAVDGSAKYAVYAEPRARHDESSLALYGRDYAAAAMPGCKDDPWRCVEEQLKLVRGAEDRKRYREEFAKLRLKGGDTADDYYRLVGRMVRDEVRGVYEAKKAELRRKVALVDKMDRFAMGEDVLSDDEVEDVRSVLEPEAMESAEAVREFMKVYVLPLEGQEDAEAVLRGISQLEDELFEVIGEDEGRAQLAYQAMMGFAQRLKDSNKMGVGDEFVVAVGKSLQNWANMVEHSSLKAAVESSEERSWANAVDSFSEELAANILAEAGAMHEKAKKDLAEYEARWASRAILREAINRSVELSKTEGFLTGSVRAASQMAGQTLPYFIPYVGMYAGTADVLVRGGTEAVEAHRLHGMGEEDARGRAALDAVVQGAVELMPWSRVGGKGFSAFTRKWMGKGMAKGTSGALSRWVVRQTQSGVGRALMAEAAVGFVDEAVLEPLAAGLLTYGGEWLMDNVLGVPHGPGREFGKCFEELGAIWSDPRQVAGMALFSAGLAGSSYRAARQNVQYFAQFRNVWLATGLKQGQVDELMAIEDVQERAKRGAAMVNEGWENDPAGMDKRVLKANRRLKERGEVLFMTGEGALAEERRVPELQDAYRAVWNEHVKRGVLPRVEARGENEFAIIEKGKPERVLDAAAADAYLQHAVDVAESVMMGEARTAIERAQGVNLRDEVADAVSRIAGNAAVRAVEAGSERTGIEVVDLVQGLPEEIAGPIVARGQVTLEDAAAISEYALGQIRALVEGGMSEQEARMTPAEAAGVARSLGEMATFAASFAKREAKAKLAPGEGAITIGRRRGVHEVEFDGARVLGQVLMTVPGCVRHYGAVEDVTESVTDMMVQQRAQVIAEEAKGEVSLAAAEEQAWDELAEVVSRAREAVLKADKTAHIEEVKKGDKMGIIEALSTMAQAKFLTSKVVPRWMQGLTDALKGILGAGVAVEKVRAAYAAVLRKKPEALADIEKVLDKLGVHVGAVLREARVEAVDVQAWKSASAVAGVRAAGPLGVGGAAVSDVVKEAERVEEEIVRAEGQQEVLPVKSAAEVAAEAKRELDARVPGSNAPEHMRGVFVEDKCYYYEPGGFWCGMIAKEKLSDGTEQVKVGVKGKHGVIQGKELTGNFRHDTAAIYIWKRKNGELQVISGRHRFAKLMEDASATSCNCYVFEETDERDEKWARMLDYELNMCDDQADEVTAATYVRETGLSDGELHRRGLMRGKSRCKRGVLIGRHAGQELWTRFANGAINPKDAEVVVELTRSLKDKSRVDEIQGKCCMLLAKKKSWEYIAGMVQLMARAEAQMTQGLLDFGADFMADLERAAEWIEKSVQKINAALAVLKDGQSMAKGRKKDDAARLGVHTETEADAEEMIRDLEMLKKQFEFIGSYPALLQQAELWDGKSEVDPIGYYLENARRERIEAAVEGEMSADEYLEAQARKMAEEAVPELFSMSMDGVQDVVAPVSFNVIGQKAETWDEYEGKAFAGRDDGMMRAEIDASQAKLKLQGISGKVLQELGDKVLAGMAGFEAAVGEEERADLVRYAELKKKGARHLTNAEIEEYRGLLRTGMGLEAQLFEALDGQVERDKVVELLTAPDRGRAVELYLQGRSKGDVEGLVYALEDVLEYPELYRAYPQLRGMRVELVQGMGRYHGVYSEKFGGIKLNAARSEEMLLSTLLHEVQHAIQYIEGFAKGGGESKAAELAGQDARYAGLRGFDLYQRMAGEIEARAVQARMGLDGAGRLASPFNEALEYPGEALVSYEMERIREAALADGTFMKAPNGKDSNLNERQWLQVRTKAFTDWFGDWNRAAELTILSNDGNFAKAKEFAKGLAGQALKNEDSGIVAFVNSEQRKELTHQSKARISQGNGFSVNGHYAVVMRIDKLFRYAVRCGIYPDLKHGDENVRIHRFACPIVIDGESAIAWMTAKATVNQEDSGRLYNLELIEINRLAGKVEDLEEHNLLLPPAASKDILARVNALRKTYFDNVSKVVDENGEPKVVYHGTPVAGIRVFEMHKAMYGEGAFFTDSPEEALSYTGLDEDDFEDWDEFDAYATKSGLLYEAFLNIRDRDRLYERNGGAWHARAVAPNEIKSATDNRGTFDGSNPDITFSMERNLAAVHSLSAEKFLGALELGGMPLPSVAVTRLDKPYSWGSANGIALVGRPELVDPRRGTEVYSADAWTGKFPRVVHKHIENADFKEAAKAAGKLEDKYGYVFYELANMLRQADTRSDLEYLLSTDTGKALFACMQGYEPKAKTVEKPMDYQFLDKQFAKDTRNMWENGDAIKEGQELAFADAVEASLERWLAAHKDAKVLALYRKLYSDLLSDLRSGRPYGVWFKLKMSLNNMGKRELDAHGNREMLAKYADKHKKAFAAWVQEKVDKWRSKEGYIRENGKEVTLDNVVSYMLSKKGLNNEAFMGFSPGKLRAALSAKMRSLDDIKARREQLGDSAESKASKVPSEQLMMEYCRFVREHLQEADADSFYAMDYGLESLSLVKGKPTEEKVARAVRKVFSYTKAGDAMAQDEELLLKGVEAVESVRREVEDYMEAVPQRAVKMDEWEYAVMPLDLKKNKAVMAGLRENGIKPRFHDGTEEGRKAALAGLVGDDKVSFSVIGQKAATWDKYADRAFKGRDDGKLRAEIDASGAKLKWKELRGKNVAAYRRIVAAWDKVPEDTRKAVEVYAEEVYDWQDESNNLNNTPEAEFLEQYNKVIKMRDAIKPKREEMRSLLNKIFVEHGGSAGAVLNMKDSELDELAMSLWGPYVEDKVEKALDMHPLTHGGMKLGDVLDFAELYEAYPELTDVQVRYASMGTARGRAIYGDGEQEILINSDLEGEWKDFHSILLHEVQHHIQNIEGFAKGGNPMMARYMVENTYSRRHVMQNELANTQAAIAWLEGVEKVRREFLNLGDAIAMRMEKSRLEDLKDKYNDLVYKYNKVAFRVEGYEADALDRGFMMPSLGGVTKAAYTKVAKAWENVKDRNAAFPGLLEKMRIKNDEQWREWNELEKGHQKWGNLSSLELYYRLAGEIEARNVQARYGWDMDRRNAIPFNSTLEYPGEALVSFSMERASLQALEVLRTRADEREGERLMNDWQRACEGWAQLHVGGDDTRLGNGAKMLGEIHALIGATKGVLPEKYARMGHLNGLLRWAAVYANMQQTGEVPESGVIAGPIYEKFVERMRYVDRKNAAFGLNEAEVKEAMAMLAGERLDVAMLKVATECKRRLELFLKDRERERIDWVVERAYPKREKGRRSPRGKMDADTYRRMERAYELMGMEAGAKAGLVERLKGVLEKLDSAPAEAVEVLRGMRHVVDVPEVDDVEALEELLEDELYLAETFGAWEAMAYEQARTASGAMAEMVLLGRNAWQQKLREERRRAAYDREEIARHFKVKLEDVLAERGDKGAKERARKRTIGKKIAMQTMSYSQLMLALEPMLGKRFVGRQMRMIAEAHERLQVGAQQRHEWMFKTLAQITGLKTEGEIEEWMVANNTVFDTGIDLEMPMKTKCRLTPEEAREWLRLTAEERAEKRQKMTEEAHAKGEKPDNVPGEDVLDELEGRLMEAEQSGLMPKEFVLETVWSYKTRLKCAKEALLFAILTFEQEDYAHLMEVNGLTDAKVQQMRKLVGPQLLRWGYAMRKELSVHGKEMAEVYEAHTGVPFGMRNNYFTGVFDVARAKDKGEAVDQPAGVGGGKYGRLISRQHHNQQLNWQTSASAVFVGTMREQLNYVATSHISRSWQTLLADRLFERRLRAEIGDAALDLIQNWCQMIDGAVLADAKVDALMHRFLGRVMAAYAVSRLAGNVYTFMKQGSALLNGFVGGYVPEHVVAGNELVQHLTYRHIGFGEYVAALAKAVSGKTEITAQELAKAGFIAGRKRVTGSHVEEAALLAPGQKVPGKLGRKMRALYEANMDAIGWADVAANTRAALAVAEVVYQQAKRENKDGLVPDAELRRVAIETAGLMIDRAAQPQLRTQKGYWAAGGGMFGALGNFFFMFKSEVLAKVGLYTAQMMAGKHGAWIVGALSFGVANSLVLALIDWIGGRWYDDDEDKWKKRLAKFSFNVVANDISSVPGVGDAVGDLRSAVLGEWSFGSSRLVDLVPFGEMGKYGAREVKNIAEEARWDKHVGALCGLARSVGAAGGWFQGGRSQTVNSCAELALAAANVSNWGRFFKDVGKKVEGKKDKPKKKRRKKKD